MDNNGHEFELREQDRWLPIANVARLMKNTLPQTAKVSKDAKECMQECVSEFISFITSEASDKCLREKRKTINGEDILYSMHDLGFENYAEVLKIYLAKYREQQALRQERGETRTSKRAQRQQQQQRQQEQHSQQQQQQQQSSSAASAAVASLSESQVPSLSHSPQSEAQGFEGSLTGFEGDDFDDGNASHALHHVQSNEPPSGSTGSIASPEPFFQEYSQTQKDYPIDEFLAGNERPIGEDEIETLTAGIANGSNPSEYF
ncbi:hypothetical protein DIURU_001299 [Diutina rugosa]|uniref:Transcription factor CBF/NF-Y/archaeal histone domain-containing protein n=1 Tax=Diutina rugosa TaxID=5481 RepID=A0A642UUW3_DIURU|nr:uncharacterized protein DIURU_001299 [Diutina rugosa]KAA8905922.1 hypothetical protein DIURU_001299 [Diutina rugosa]